MLFGFFGVQLPHGSSSSETRYCKRGARIEREIEKRKLGDGYGGYIPTNGASKVKLN